MQHAASSFSKPIGVVQGQGPGSRGRHRGGAWPDVVDGQGRSGLSLDKLRDCAAAVIRWMLHMHVLGCSGLCLAVTAVLLVVGSAVMWFGFSAESVPVWVIHRVWEWLL